jgi:Family of unknown function (DUF6523)
MKTPPTMITTYAFYALCLIPSMTTAFTTTTTHTSSSILSLYDVPTRTSTTRTLSPYTTRPTATITTTTSALSSTSPKKGFGSDKEIDKVKEVKPKTAGAQKRDEGSKKYDEIAALGGQEYRIFVRQFGSSDQSWLPCGLIAVPRGAQVSAAIYGNVMELQKAIVRTYPKLKDMEIEFEYGYNLKIYPDDPIEVAKNTGPTNDNIFTFGGWMKSLLSPMDTSKVPPPPTP